jgi:glutamate---cysteine ligase / carboxylate-amine ligase
MRIVPPPYPMTAEPTPLSAADLRAAFDAPEPLTIGIEEELMLLDRETFDLLPRAPEVVEAAGDERFKLELPAAQLELSLPPVHTVPEAVAALATARRDLAAAAAPVGRLACAGVHPFAAPIGVLNDGDRYALTEREYGSIARRQLVCALQVHVAVGGADRSLAVYNGLRPWLPLIAALAANAPFHDGRDTGLASIRPKIAEQLPRQGIPPAIASWESFAGALEWGAASGAVPDARRWWWELRPHPAFGTLELRVPDAQTTVADAAAVLALVHSLAGWLAACHDAGEALETADTWRLEENRWSAARSGIDAELADLRSGARTPARELLAQLVDRLAPVARELGCARELATTARLAEDGGAARQRAVAAHGGPRAVAEWLASAYVPEPVPEPEPE